MKYELLTAVGLRVFPNGLGQLRLPEGGFGRDLSGKWFVRPPGCDMGDLDSFHVEEHADGTISVEESIDGRDDLQGHWRLERGVWTSIETAQRLVNQTGGVA
mgnify:CR=1 FL=1